MNEEIKIVSTKKLLNSQKQFFLNTDLTLIEADFIKVELLNFELDYISEYLIFTSQNAVRSVLKCKQIEILKSKKCFCVGEKTRELLELNGFNVVVSRDYSNELATIISKEFPEESFTFFCGNLRREELPKMMKKMNINFEEVVVYRTYFHEQKLNSTRDGILFFSPSGVKSFLKENNIVNEICFCIGKTTAEALEGISKNIVIANHPTVEDTIIKCINYYKQKS